MNKVPIALAGEPQNNKTLNVKCKSIWKSVQLVDHKAAWKWLGFDMGKIGEETKRKFDLKDRLIEFSVMVIGIIEFLPETRTCSHLGGQLLRSGTSAALNYGEAQGAESRKDFVHKIKIILKELRESRISLRILDRRSLLQSHSVLIECNELVAIFTKSAKTASSNPGKDR